MEKPKEQPKDDTLVEVIKVEELVAVHDADCPHVNLVRDGNGDDRWNTFVCDNPNCGEVFIFPKD